ncbi:head decoration protein [Paraburkholderia megapolitana]|uniref:Bacteriophage lambda head decoration protein D n=1 Tax=Paraburkholderia megapolitana TaxID=420953 RepID=A0A1I3U7H7_9BURK|nr:head decoration protein [Paraburkholderia megapolitana]QDQ83635.1 head decoration protein [Paraburkholderia megapolitana]SFJ78960.1 Bacteriophage lambda head decoration protein D [Paraburkholderia megapolitana]
MSNIRTQGSLPAEFLLSEGNGQISRERIVVKEGPALPSGQVLGVTGTGQYAPYSNTANDGSEAAAAILYAPLPADSEPRWATVIVRLAEVSASLLTDLDAAGRSDLATHMIIVR